MGLNKIKRWLQHNIQQYFFVLIIAGGIFSIKGAHRSLAFNDEFSGNDSLSRPDYILKNIQWNQPRRPYILYDQNSIQWQNYSAISSFFQALKFASYKKVKVMHYGDSHVQCEIATGYIRNRLQDIFGDGGRGMMFPYASAKTHSGYDYYTYSHGIWESARNLHPTRNNLGSAGYMIKTQDPNAGFKFLFNKYFREANNTVLKIYCMQSPKSYDLRIRTDVSPDPIIVSCRDSVAPFVTAYLPSSPRSIQVDMLKTSPYQTGFECHGVSIEQPERKGILYNSCGVNGATLSGILRQNLMDNQLKEMQPDLVVVDLAGNDYYAGGLNEAEFENKLRAIVQKIRDGSPGSSILITCAQDIYRFARFNVAEGKKAALIAARVAFTTNCAFYDYYKISGGQYSMLKWYADHLAKNDKVHLTYDGYQTKGELYVNAILKSFYSSLLGSENSIIPVDSSFKYYKEEPKLVTSPGNASVSSSKSGNDKHTFVLSSKERKVTYRVSRGDNLGIIASKFHVSVGQIMSWNGLRSTIIRPNQILTIFTRVNEVTNSSASKTSLNPSTQSQVSPNSKSTKTTDSPPKNTATIIPDNPSKAVSKSAPPTQGKKRPFIYYVQSGDNLWLISVKYNTTVEAIKIANRLYSNKLSIGQKLIIP